MSSARAGEPPIDLIESLNVETPGFMRNEHASLYIHLVVIMSVFKLEKYLNKKTNCNYRTLVNARKLKTLSNLNISQRTLLHSLTMKVLYQIHHTMAEVVKNQVIYLIY